MKITKELWEANLEINSVILTVRVEWNGVDDDVLMDLAITEVNEKLGIDLVELAAAKGDGVGFADYNLVTVGVNIKERDRC